MSSEINENQYPSIIIDPSGGLYDEREYEFEVVSGGGCFVPYFVDHEIVAPGVTLTQLSQLPENEAFTIDITLSGGNYDERDHVFVIVSGSGCFVPPFIPQTPITPPDPPVEPELPAATPAFTTMTNIVSMPETEPAPFQIDTRDGLYDELDVVVEVVSGSGGIVTKES